ncbi:MAG: lysozyme inhibitor LprI family protein [Cyanobacteria bacterium P01_F01_bin.116]
MDKPTYKVLSLLLLLSLVSCGQSKPVTAPEESVGTTSTSETTEAAPTDAAESPAANDALEPAPTDVSEEPARPSPVEVTKKDCGQMVTQQDMNQCAAENYAVSDKALNQVYQQVSQGLDDTAKAQLTTAEERWLAFRDAQCTFESDRFEGGSMAPLIQASCLERLTDNRMAELQQADRTDISYRDVDAQLNEVYQAIQALTDDAAGDALTDVQLSWLDYRDAHCEYEANLPSAPDVKTCLAAITQTRVWQLEALKDDLSL